MTNKLATRARVPKDPYIKRIGLVALQSLFRLLISSLAGPSGRAYLGSCFERFMGEKWVVKILRPD